MDPDPANHNASPIAHLEAIGDPEALWLKYHRDLWRWSVVEGGAPWMSIRDTANLEEWSPLLQEFGLDVEATTQLCLLAQQGPAGRAEANRLVHHLIKKGRPIQQVSSWMTKLVKEARQFHLDKPPADSPEWLQWTWYTCLAGEPGTVDTWGRHEQDKPRQYNPRPGPAGPPPGPSGLTPPDCSESSWTYSTWDWNNKNNEETDWNADGCQE